MARVFPRRSLFQLAGAAALLRGRVAAQQAPAAGQAPAPVRRPNNTATGHPEPLPGLEKRSNVALIQGEDRRKTVRESLMAIDKEIQAKMKGKKSIVIKPNFVNTQNQLAASHADTMRGILDYLSDRFKGPVFIAEASAGDTEVAFENFKYKALTTEYKRLSLVDLNREAKFERAALLDADLHIVPVRLAARLLDPEAFVISSCMLKTHNTVIASLGIKNMTLGAPLHYAPGETTRWNDKRKYHVGLRQTHYNMLVTVQRLAPTWGLSVIDGHEGMEGNGPSSGTPVASRVVIASTDFVAADRIGAEAMSVDPEWLGYAKFSGGLGLGQYDMAKIDVIGAKVADIKKPYRMHPDIEKELKWQGPMTELPFNLGWIRGIGDLRPA